MMWFVYFFYAIFYHLISIFLVHVEMVLFYADLSYENSCFIDELPPEFVEEQINKQIFGED